MVKEARPPRMKGGTRSVRKDRTRHLILAASASLFAAKAFDKVTMREIAETAGMGLPTLYQYFQDKQALYDATVLSQQALQGIRFDTAIDEIHSLDDFGRWLEIVVTISLEQRKFSRLLSREMLTDRPDVIEALSRRFDLFYKRLMTKINLVCPGAGDGVLPMLILAAVNGFVTIYPFRERLTNYAPGLPRTNLDAAEREAITAYLFQMIRPAPDSEDGAVTARREIEDDVRWLRAAVIELTIENMKLRAAGHAEVPHSRQDILGERLADANN